MAANAAAYSLDLSRYAGDFAAAMRVFLSPTALFSGGQGPRRRGVANRGYARAASQPATVVRISSLRS